MKRLGPCLLALALLASGCAPQPGLAATPTPVPDLPRPATATAPAAASATPAPTVTATTPAIIDPVSSPIPADLLALPEVEQAQSDLAARLGVAPADLLVIAVQPMTWTGSNMGCPQPGMDYLQVLVDGYLIHLAYAGQTYAYHSGGGQPPFLCEPSPLGQKAAPTLAAP